MSPIIIAGSVVNPSVGASEFQTPNVPSIVQVVRVDLTTDATVADRHVSFEFWASGIQIALATHNLDQSASVSIKYCAGVGLENGADSGGLRQTIRLPNIVLPPLSTIKVTVDNAVAGDAITLCAALVLPSCEC